MRRKTLWIVGLTAMAVLAARPLAAQEYFADVGHEASYDTSNIDRENADLRARAAELESQLNAALEGSYGCCADACCGCRCADWFAPCCCDPTVVYYLAGDGWRNKADGQGNNNFGNRLGVNTSWNLGGNGVRGQLGGSYGAYNYHGRLRSVFGPSQSVEEQVFITAGVSHRASDPCCDYWTWGLAYDYQHDAHYGEFGHRSVDLHQARFVFGRLMDPCNEIGVWGAVGLEDDEIDRTFPPPNTSMSFFRVPVRPMDQVHLYWRRYWECGGETVLYAGLGEAQPDRVNEQSQSVFVTPGGDDLTEVVVGLRGVAPLTCNIGLFGSVHYVIPSTTGGNRNPNGVQRSYAEEIWNVSFGVMFVRGCNLPLLPVADNGLFSVQAPPGS